MCFPTFIHACVLYEQIGAVCSGSTLFASILYSSVMLGNYLEQTTSEDNILDPFFLGTLRVKSDHDNGRTN